jgi:hypothetical protein
MKRSMLSRNCQSSVTIIIIRVTFVIKATTKSNINMKWNPLHLPMRLVVLPLPLFEQYFKFFNRSVKNEENWQFEGMDSTGFIYHHYLTCSCCWRWMLHSDPCYSIAHTTHTCPPFIDTPPLMIHIQQLVEQYIFSLLFSTTDDTECNTLFLIQSEHSSDEPTNQVFCIELLTLNFVRTFSIEATRRVQSFDSWRHSYSRLTYPLFHPSFAVKNITLSVTFIPLLLLFAIEAWINILTQSYQSLPEPVDVVCSLCLLFSSRTKELAPNVTAFVLKEGFMTLDRNDSNLRSNQRLFFLRSDLLFRCQWTFWGYSFLVNLVLLMPFYGFRSTSQPSCFSTLSLLQGNQQLSCNVPHGTKSCHCFLSLIVTQRILRGLRIKLVIAFGHDFHASLVFVLQILTKP